MTTHVPGLARDHADGYPAPGLGPTSIGEQPGSAPVVVRAAPRRRASQRGVLVSVLVVLVGGLLAFAGAQELTRHTLVLAVTRDVPVGGTITDQDLVTASVTSDPNVSPIPASQRSQVVGQIAQVALVKGELLTRGQFGAGPGFAWGQVLVALPLKLGQFPGQGLTAGQKVLIVATPGPGSAGASSSPAGSAQASEISAVVAGVAGQDPATQVTVIDVRVQADVGASVAELASTGNLAVILLPAGG